MEKERPTAMFPWPYCLLNGLLIYGIATVSLAFSKSSINNGSWIEMLTSLPFFAAIAFIGSVIVVFFCSIYHVAIFWMLKNRVYRQPYWMGLFLLPAIVVIGLSAYEPSEKTKAKSMLQAGRLGEIPNQATHIQYFGWSGMFTGAQYLKFEASTESIDQFIQESTSLLDIEPQHYSEGAMRLPYPENLDLDWNSISKEQMENYYRPHHDAPDWYLGPLRNEGRRYEVPPNGEGHNWGEVLIDDLNHIVYVYIVWS